MRQRFILWGYMRAYSCLKIQDGASTARSDDTNSLRKYAPTYIAPNPNRDVVDPPIVGASKSGRGFSHPLTALLLCPRERLDDLIENPRDVS